jgi:hypothetical protein
MSLLVLLPAIHSLQFNFPDVHYACKLLFIGYFSDLRDAGHARRILPAENNAVYHKMTSAAATTPG